SSSISTSIPRPDGFAPSTRDAASAIAARRGNGCGTTISSGSCRSPPGMTARTAATARNGRWCSPSSTRRRGSEMADIILMKTVGASAPEVEKGQAEAGKLITGEYKTRTWNHFTGEDGRLYCGIWESTPGKVAIDYKEWEFCHFIEGKAVITNEDGRKWTLKAGDGFIIPQGFKG